jgi:chloramphenicol O-acetyltransferase
VNTETKELLAKFNEESGALWDKVFKILDKEKARIDATLTPSQRLYMDFVHKIQLDLAVDGYSEFTVGEKRYSATVERNGRLKIEENKGA